MFNKILPREIRKTPFDLIGQEWMLVTAGNLESYNTMTASWGGMGHMWGKDVCFVVVRPSRYTYEFVESNASFTLSFFDGAHKDELTLLGSKSGRDCDKVKQSGLTPVQVEGGVSFAESSLVLCCKKLYYQDMQPENFLDSSIDSKWYSAKHGSEYHRLYVSEITCVLSK